MMSLPFLPGYSKVLKSFLTSELLFGLGGGREKMGDEVHRQRKDYRRVLLGGYGVERLKKWITCAQSRRF